MIHDASAENTSSEEEIHEAISADADVLMLPYFKSVDEVKRFLTDCGGRVKTILLFETKEAVELADEILALPGIDEAFIGLNDLSLSYQKKFLFEPLADGMVDSLCEKFREKGIPFGFGGIAGIGQGMLPAEYVIREHYRIGSERVILSRSFCNCEEIKDYDEIRRVFEKGIPQIRNLEAECMRYEQNSPYFTENRKKVIEKVRFISDSMK